jgi:hypothetical protein
VAAATRAGTVGNDEVEEREVEGMLSAGTQRLLRRLELLGKVLETTSGGVTKVATAEDKETQTLVSLQQGSHHLVSQIKQLGGVVKALRAAEVITPTFSLKSHCNCTEPS